MSSIAIAFVLSLLLTLALTPWVRRLGKACNMVDLPSPRKVHQRPLPRCGGAAVYPAVIMTVGGVFVLSPAISDRLTLDPALPWCAGGATLVFLLGLADDRRRLHPAVKFAVQIAAACLAYGGGARITQVALYGLPTLSLEWLSLPATIFWILLVVNAVNLIDGLDGLAAGVVFFTAMVLLVPAVLAGKAEIAVCLAALAGACLGFLRYNFNPASIFMGDSGSYFLGYCLAVLSMLGAMKTQTGAAMLIPVIALWMPLMDVLLAPVRRFIIGRALFRPDREHIHHRLLRLGFTQRAAVLILYGCTLLCGALALLTIVAQDASVGLLFFILAVTVIFGVRKLGYFRYLTATKIADYVQDVSDVMEITRERRTFLNRQLAIAEAADIDELWQRIVAALQELKFDHAELCFNGAGSTLPRDGGYRWCGADYCGEETERRSQLLQLNLPLTDEHQSFGALHLCKDLSVDPIGHYTLRRIEHLRRSIVRKPQTFQWELEVPPAAGRADAPLAATAVATATDAVLAAPSITPTLGIKPCS